MKRNRMWVVALALVFPGAPALWAQAPGSGPLPLSLEEAVARATEGSEEVRLARSQLELAEAQVVAARSAALPQVNANLAYTRTFESPFSSGTEIQLPDSLRFEPDPSAPLEERVAYLENRTPIAGLAGLGQLFGNLPFGRENTYVASVTGSQLVYSGGRVGAALEIAGHYEDAARLNVEEAVADIELQVETAYYGALLARELEAISRAAVEQAEAFLEQERLRQKSGAASELDVMRAEVALENLRPQLVQAKNASELALLNLKRLVGLPLQQALELTTPLERPAETERALPEPGAALRRRAALEAAERQVAIREQQVRIARRAFLPTVSLHMTYGRQLYPTSPFDFSGEASTDWNAGVSVQVPVFDGLKRKAEVEQAEAELEQARLRAAQLRETVELQYEQAKGERERALAAISARERTVAQAERVYDLTELRYRRGLATQLEVSDARLALLQARTNLAQALSDYHVADAALVRSLGGRSAIERRAGAER